MNIKRISLFIILIFSFSFVHASELSINSDKYILYSISNDEVLLEKDSNVKTSVASLTKIMSVIVALENIKDYDEEITITKEMINNIDYDVAVAGFKVGNKVTYNDLLYSAIVASAADSVQALAVSISGNKDDFVKLMNEKAKELGMNDTNYTNVIGLYDSMHYSTAKDTMTLLLYALKNDKFKDIFEAKYYITSNNIKLQSTISKYNDNKNDISFITGAKTGYLSKSGNCLASTAHIKGVDYLLITLNSYKGSTSHIIDASNIYSYYGSLYEMVNVVNEDTKITTLKTKYSSPRYIDIYSSSNIDMVLSSDSSKNITYKYDIVEDISVFTSKGEIIGNVKIMLDDKEINNFDLIYNENLRFSLLYFIIDNIFIELLLVILLVFFFKIKKKIKKKYKTSKN